MDDENRVADVLVKDTSEQFNAVFWPAFQAALAQGMTEPQIEAAMAAARAEHPKWIGALNWSDAMAAIVGAAFRAASKGE